MSKSHAGIFILYYSFMAYFIQHLWSRIIFKKQDRLEQLSSLLDQYVEGGGGLLRVCGHQLQKFMKNKVLKSGLAR